MTDRDVRPIDTVMLLPDNPRQGDIGAISESLRRFGQQKPIVINSDGVILAGNHTYQAAVALGWTQIWVHETELDGQEQTGFALADNRLSDLSSYDNTQLLELLEAADDLTGLGYDAADVEQLRHIAAAYGADAPLDPYAHWQGMPEFKQEERNAAFQTRIYFPSQEDADRFFAMIGVAKRRSFWWPLHDGHVGDHTVDQAWMAEEE